MNVHLWNANTGHPLTILRGHTDNVRTLAFSPDNRLFASGGADETIRIWDLHHFQHLLTLRTSSSVYAVAFSPDGYTLASTGIDGIIRLWEPITGDQYEVLSGHFDDANIVTFSPDGKTLASCGDGIIFLWDLNAVVTTHY